MKPRSLTSTFLVISFFVCDNALAQSLDAKNTHSGKSRIVFSSQNNLNSDIYIMNPDGSDMVRLTDNARPGHVPGHIHPAWSPDGTKIAYSTDPERHGFFSIWVMNRDGSGQTRLTGKSRNFFSPVWTSDGTKIVFAERNRDGLYIMNSDGSGRKRLSFTKDSHVAWLPDGTGYTCYSENAADGGGLYIFNLDGTIRSLLLAAEDAISDWSPDGTALVCNLKRDGKWSTVTMNADGSKVQTLGNRVAEHTTLSWSPDGQRIVYVSDQDGNFEIYVMDSDGRNQARLTRNRGYDGDPDWSPFLAE